MDLRFRTTTTLVAVADTHVHDSGSESENFGDLEYFGVVAPSVEGQNNGLVAFDAAGILQALGSDEIVSATLVLHLMDIPLPQEIETAQSMTAHRMAQPWTEMGAVWECADDQDTSPSGLDCDRADEWDQNWGGNNPWAAAGHFGLYIEEAGTRRIEFDVTADVSALVAGEPWEPSWLLLLPDDLGWDPVFLESRESTAGPAPSLELVHQPPLPGPPLPPDPSSVAPPLDATQVDSAYDAYSFLFDGATPIQTGFTAGAIEPGRIAVIRGTINLRNGNPAVGVTVRAKGHPEYGETLTRDDGVFDIAVNGGGPVTLELSRDGLIPVERTIAARWQRAMTIENVVMIGRDPAVTQIDFSDDINVAEGTPVIDDDGYRRQVLMFRDSTVATMRLPDDTTQPLPVINVRSTEFTVGETGLQAMPAALPANTAYTYAVDFSIDEAEAAGAVEVTFNPPAISYSTDFLLDPATGTQALNPGEVVPAGSYSFADGQWRPEHNGIVIRVVQVGANLGVDVTNDVAENLASLQELAAIGITRPELEVVLERFPVGTQLWRVETEHFSGWDLNMGVAPPADAPDPPGDGPEPPALDGGCEQSGSIIECENQVLGESIGVPGTPLSINYRSSRVKDGPHSRFSLPITGSTVHADVQRVVVETNVAGRRFVTEYPATPDLTHEFIWDGVDLYGRQLQGPRPATVCAGHVYASQYFGMGPCWEAAPTCADPAAFEKTFGYAGNGRILTGERGGAEVTLWSCFGDAAVAGSVDGRGLSGGDQHSVGSMDALEASDGLGGWTLNIHHTFVPIAGILYKGDGTTRSGVGAVATRFAGTGSGSGTATGDHRLNVAVPTPTSLAAGPDGSLYIGNASRVVRVRPDDGIVELFAGTGTSGFSGDGGPATSAQVSAVRGLAVAPDGSVYLADGGNRRIRRVASDGTITTVAGNGAAASGYADVDNGLGGPATAVPLGSPRDVTVRDDGVAFFGHDGGVSWTRISFIDDDGDLHHFAGYPFPDELDQTVFDPTRPPASQVVVRLAERLAFAPNGDLLVGGDGSVSGADIMRLGSVGTVEWDDHWTAGIGFAGDAPILISGGGSNLVYQGGTDGFELLAGGGPDPSAAGEPALSHQFGFLRDLVTGPDGAIYIADSGHEIIRVSKPTPGGAPGADTAIASVDGSQVYVFSAEGRHLETRSATTDALIWQFGYDAGGLLTTITDQDGNDTTISRNGATITITSPDGVASTLGLNATGYLASFANPESETHVLTYDGGLLETFTEPGGGLWTFTYDSGGRLISDEDAEGGSKTLVRSETADGWTVDLTTAMGRTTVYAVDSAATGDLQRTVTSPTGTSNSGIATNDGGFAQVVNADGTTRTWVRGPDPRFGMQAPVTEVYTVGTPGGVVRDLYSDRSVDPGDVLVARRSVNDATFANPFTTSYDPATQTATWTTAENRSGTITFDASGRVEQVASAGLAAVTVTRAPDGKISMIAAGSGASERRADFTYQPSNGFLDTVTAYLEALGLSVDFDTDLVGRAELITLEDLSTVAFAYDSGGRLASLTPPGRPPHAVTYNALGQLELYTPPPLTGTGPTDFVYNLDHQLDDILRPDATVIDLAYGASSGQLTGLTVAGGTMVPAYDPATQQVTALAGPYGVNLAYDYDGFLLESTTWSGAVAGSVSQTYDDELRVATQSVNGTSTVAFDYDLDGLLTLAGAETLWPDQVTGLVTDTDVGGVSSHLEYNEFGEPIVVEYTFGTVVLYRADLVRDDFGRVVENDEIVDDGTPILYEYDYDDRGRLWRVWEDSILVAEYGYDANGNILDRTTPGGVTAGVYDDQDRQTDWGADSYTYGAAGELEQKTDSVDTTTYDYDELGNLLSVTLPGPITIDYEVDAMGRRVERFDGIEGRRFLYQDGLNPVAELDDLGAIVSRFVYGTRGHVPDYVVNGGTTYRLITDHLGSVRLVVDASTGVVVERLDYDERGFVIDHTGTIGFQPFGFAGGIYDPDTGLVRFGARDYDPQTRRWTAKDPILFAGGDTNLYGYVLGDPINGIDPNGLTPGVARWDQLCAISPSTCGTLGRMLNPQLVSGLFVLYCASGACTPGEEPFGPLRVPAPDDMVCQDGPPANDGNYPLPESPGRSGAPPGPDEPDDRDFCYDILAKCINEFYVGNCLDCTQECLLDGKWPFEKCHSKT